MQAEVVSGLTSARLEVENACRSLALASPEALTASEKALERAAVVLRQGQAAWDWKSAGEPGRIESARLQAGIRRAGRLLASATGYHAGWLRILSAMTGGYSPQGEAAPLPRMRRISIEG